MKLKLIVTITILFCLMSGSMLGSGVFIDNNGTTAKGEDTERKTLDSTIIDMQMESQLEMTMIQARQLKSQLGRTETVIEASAAFAEQIWKNDSYIPDVDSFYHNKNVDISPPLPTPPDLYFDSTYGREISMNCSTYKIAPRAFDESYRHTYLSSQVESVDPLTKIDPEMREAINKSAKMDIIWSELYKAFPENIWLYMGFESGFHRSYPWHEYSRTYDPTVRPWYVGAVTGSKDVVLILDTSGSMTGEPIQNSKEAAKKVLGTLGPNDRFTILTFSGFVDPMWTSLEIASKPLINEASDHIDTIVADGGTNINGALLEGLSILEDHGAVDRTPVIIFLTDGKATEGVTHTETIIANVDGMNTDVQARLFLFGLGSNIDSYLINQLAHENDGAGVYIQDSEDLEEAMSRYGQFFISDIEPTITWSFPYVDASGRGLIISASKAVVVEDELIGVVSTDIILTDLIDLLESFKPKHDGRSFIFDVGGTTVLHPNFLDLPMSDWLESEIRVPIEEYETYDENFVKLKEDAMNGIAGADIVNYQGSRMIVAMSPIEGTSMIYCSVDSLEQLHDETEGMTFDEIVLKLEEENHHDQAVQHAEALDAFFSRIAAVEKTIGSYTNRLLEDNDPTGRPIYYHDATMDRATPDPVFSAKHGKTIDLDASGYLVSPNPEQLWNWSDEVNETINLYADLDLIFQPMYTSTEEILWTYMGFENGVHRTYPFHGLSSSYDPRIRPWYTTAVDADPGTVTFTTPFIDAATGKVIITAALAIYQSEELIGVIGIDILLKTIQDKVLSIDPGDSGKAFLINDDGNVLAHPSHKLPNVHWNTTDLEVSITNYETNTNGFQELLNNASNGYAGQVITNYGHDLGEHIVSLIPLKNANLIFGLVKSKAEGIERGGDVVIKGTSDEDSDDSSILIMGGVVFLITIVVVVIIMKKSSVRSHFNEMSKTGFICPQCRAQFRTEKSNRIICPQCETASIVNRNGTLQIAQTDRKEDR